jgi:putative transposase
VQQPTPNQRWRSDIFLIPCWNGEVLSVAFAIDCHDREVFAWTASPRPLNGGDIRTLMDKAVWARFGEETTTAPHAIQWLSACYERVVKSCRLSATVPLGGPIE